MKEQKINSSQGSERRKLISGLGILSIVTLVSGLSFFKKKKQIIACNPHENKTVKMLTEDGRLVEVDANLLASNKKIATDKDLQSWIKR